MSEEHIQDSDRMRVPTIPTTLYPRYLNALTIATDIGAQDKDMQKERVPIQSVKRN